MNNSGMWEPCRVDEFDLWTLNHSVDKLQKEQRLNYSAYKLGYEMKEETDDPENKAYKFFSDERYPKGNVVDSAMYDYDPERKVALCMDFNRSPQTGALGQTFDDKYLVFDEAWLDEGLTREQADNVISVLSGWNIEEVVLYGDNTSNQRAGKYGRQGRNDWQIVKAKLEEAGIKYDASKLRKQNPKRKVRVDKVNNLIYAGEDSEGNPIRQLLIHERCQKVIRDYNYSVIGTKGKDEGLKIDDGDKGHISDAVDYWLYENERGSRSYKYVL